MTERIEIPMAATSGDGGPLPVDLARPSGDPRGAVVVVQEAFGVNDHIRSLCDRLAADGWAAYAPHLFHRQGSPELDYEDMAAVMEVFKSVHVDGIRADIDATLALLATEGFERAQTGLIGFCMGGTIALWAAATYELGACVTFYGSGITEARFGLPSGLDSGARLRSPWLGLYGDQDRGIPTEQVEQLRSVVAGASVPTAIVRYPEAAHGFNCDARAAYHAESASDAWSRMLGWLGQNASMS